MACYNFPAIHWQCIHTTNAVESTFATIRHRTRLAKGCLNRIQHAAHDIRTGQCAEKRWRRLRGLQQLGKVIEGVKFKNGIEQIQVNDRVAA